MMESPHAEDSLPPLEQLLSIQRWVNCAIAQYALRGSAYGPAEHPFGEPSTESLAASEPASSVSGSLWARRSL